MRGIKFDVILWDKGDPASIEHYTLQEAIREDFIDFKDGAMIPTDDSVIIREFTGLKDKNGKEIYHQDFLKSGDDIILVEWRQDLASFCLRKNGWMFDHFFQEASHPDRMEIIGNIYENPELTGDYNVGRN